MRPPKKLALLTRRHWLVGSPATALSPAFGATPSGPAIVSDTIAAVAERWIAIKQTEEALSRRWSEIETWLIDNFDWTGLDEDEQQSLPEAKPLYAIEECLDLLEQQRRECRTTLVSLPTVTLRHLLVKLQVAIDMINPVDNCDAHHLFTVAIADLEGLIAAQVAS